MPFAISRSRGVPLTIKLERQPAAVCDGKPCWLIDDTHIRLVRTAPYSTNVKQMPPFYEFLVPGEDVSYGCWDPNKDPDSRLTAAAAGCNAASTDKDYGNAKQCGCALRDRAKEGQPAAATRRMLLVRHRHERQSRGRVREVDRGPDVLGTACCGCHAV